MIIRTDDVILGGGSKHRVQGSREDYSLSFYSRSKSGSVKVYKNLTRPRPLDFHTTLILSLYHWSLSLGRLSLLSPSYFTMSVKLFLVAIAAIIALGSAVPLSERKDALKSVHRQKHEPSTYVPPTTTPPTYVPPPPPSTPPTYIPLTYEPPTHIAYLPLQ